MASTCFSTSGILNWDLFSLQMVHFFVGMPVMCSDMLQNSMHGVCWSIKTRNWYPVIKGYVVVFHATPPLSSWDYAVDVFLSTLLALAAESARKYHKLSHQWGLFVSRRKICSDGLITMIIDMHIELPVLYQIKTVTYWQKDSTKNQYLAFTSIICLKNPTYVKSCFCGEARIHFKITVWHNGNNSW